jgi:ribose transport system ATP-binding protein
MPPTDEIARPEIVRASGMSISFGGVRVVDNVDLVLHPGEVVALLGENGAGKSSLMKMLAGVYVADRGTIVVDDEEIAVDSVRRARACGITMIHQELNLVDNLSISENIALGREPRRGPNALGVVDRRESLQQAGAALREIGSHLDPRYQVGKLSIAQQQIVEIAKALAQDNVRVLLMDEPTSSLPEEQASDLVDLILRLRETGLAIVVTTHRIPEAFAVADRIVVMRDGSKVAEYDAHDSSVTRDSIVNAMIGRELTALFPDKRTKIGPPVLEVTGMSGGFVEDIDLTVREGEIFGLGGLVGAGRTEFARLLFGCDKRTSGSILIDGREKSIRGPRDAVRAGMGFIPEDRKREGLVLGLDIEENYSLPNLPEWSRFGILSLRALSRRAQSAIASYRVRARSSRQLVRTLSGGNQQKVVLAKWMATPKRLLILDEPTRGVDVGARQEIYRAIDEIAASGVGVLLISSDMEELIGLSDRIGVMADGRLQGVLAHEQATQARIFELASKLEEVL